MEPSQMHPDTDSEAGGPDQQPEPRLLATRADLGVTKRRGTEWAADDIEDALWGPGAIGRDDTHPDAGRIASAIQAAANKLVHRIAAALPIGLHLVDEQVWGPADTDVEALAREALRWKERASFAEIVAETGLWQPPDPAIAPCVRIEGRRDVATESGHAVSVLANREEAEYWGVYAIGPDGLADWTADFAALVVARRHAARWHRPGSLVCTDLTEDLNEQDSAPSPAHLNPNTVAAMLPMPTAEDGSDRPADSSSPRR